MNWHKSVSIRLACALIFAAIASSAFALNPPQYAFSINLTQTPQPFSPVSLGIDSSGNLYAGCSGDVVAKMSGNGSFITQWSVISPSALAVDNAINYVFVIDSEDYTVNEFFLDGTFYQEWGGTGSLAGQFNGPSGISVSTDGSIFVADTFNNRIQIFYGNVSYGSQWGVLGDGPGQLDGPGGVAVDSSNNVYVIDIPTNAVNNFRIQRFTANGTYLNEWFTPAETTAYVGIGGITTDNSNRVYVADSANMDILIYDTNGTLLTKFGSAGSGPGQINMPGGVAVDPTGNYIYVADYYNARIDVFAYAPASPIIYAQPASQTVPAGANVTFSASAFGAATLAYQWLSNGIAIPGATTSTLTFLNLDPSISGTVYSILVTNSLGSMYSSNAVLTVAPALVNTLAANGISATGAVLNGSVTTGSYPTVSWFEWGTDTTYGNATSPSSLPSGATSAVSNALSGLSGVNVYHYRIDASNSLGVTFGADQSFSVGLKPVVANLPVSNVGSTSATINASINPEGLSTGAYFEWGQTTGYGHLTPVSNLGSGAQSVTSSATITGLVSGVIYHYLTIATNRLGIANGGDRTFIAGPWNLSLSTNNTIMALAMSADGTGMTAGTESTLFLSHDGGVSWRPTNSPDAVWQAMCSSADGRLIAIAGSEHIFTSTNSGTAWSDIALPFHNWFGLASSADGTRLAMVGINPGVIFTSTNGGSLWTSNNVPTSFEWGAIASSSDGLKFVACAGGAQPGSGMGPIYTSTNCGVNWSTNNVPRAYWQSVAISADGTKLAAAAGGASETGPIYVSHNSGLNWNPTTAPVTNWQAIASSADGTHLAAIPRTGGLIWFSVDSGSNWTSSLLPSATWYCLATSADGGKIAVGGSQGLFTLQNVVAPSLTSSASGGNVVVSWIVPSVPFQLQSTPNLFRNNWSPVTNSPVLVPGSVLNQVTLPLATPAGFYRLVQP